jgi:hypothetical protein
MFVVKGRMSKQKINILQGTFSFLAYLLCFIRKTFDIIISMSPCVHPFVPVLVAFEAIDGL